MMDYATHLENNLPIGSGVTEAACKTLVKQRLCGSGMRWKDQGAKVILSLRALVQSKGRWQQFGIKSINMVPMCTYNSHYMNQHPSKNRLYY